MAKQTINLGTSANKGDGDPLRTAFDKVNDNFDELYAQAASDIVLSSINASLIPDTDVAYDLGSTSKRFRDLYLSGSTIDLGGTTLSIVGGELQLGGVKVPTTADVASSIASAVSAPTGDLTGSVFADDSTLLVDGVAGKIVGPVDTASITQSDTGNFTSNFTTTITQDNQYTKFTKVDVFDNDGIVSTINREIKLGANSLLFDSTVGASATIGNSSVGGSLVLEAGSGNASEGNADGGDIYLTSGYSGVGGDGGNIILNSNADIFVGPLANTLDIRIGGGPGYAGENNTFFYGNVNIDSGKKLDTESVTNSSGNLQLDSSVAAVIIGTNATQTIINGDVDFGNSGTIDFTGATVKLPGFTSVDAQSEITLADEGGAGIRIENQSTSSDPITIVGSGDVSINSINGQVLIETDLNGLHSVFVNTGKLTLQQNQIRVITYPPGSSKGSAGDEFGMFAFGAEYIYYCTTTYTDGVADIWKRVAWSGDTW